MDETMSKEQLHEELSTCQAILEMRQSRGWAILHKDLTNFLSILDEQLRIETDLEKIRKVQARYFAISSLLKTVEGYSKNSDFFRECLDDLEVEEAFIQKYSL